MNQVELILIIEKLKKIAQDMYNETADKVDSSFEIDTIIDELEKALPFFESGL